MTGEEMERAIDFLLKSQAGFEARMGQFEARMEQFQGQVVQNEARFSARFEQINQQIAANSEQLAETNKQLGGFADTQADIMHVMTRTLEAQARINESQKEFNLTISEALARLAESQAHTDRRLDALIDIVQSRRNGE